MTFKDIKVIMGKRAEEDSNVGYPIYGDLTVIFNEFYGSVFEKVYIFLGFIFEDDIIMYGVDFLLDNFRDTLIHDIERAYRIGDRLKNDEVYIKVKGMKHFMHFISLEPIIFDKSDKIQEA